MAYAKTWNPYKRVEYGKVCQNCGHAEDMGDVQGRELWCGLYDYPVYWLDKACKCFERID